MVAAGIEDVDHRGHTCSQSTEMAPGSQRTDEDTVIVGVGRHPQPVAQNGTAADRTGRIDCQDCDTLPSAAQRTDQPVDQR